MQKVKYINPRGESVYFDIKPPYILQRIEGTGGVEVNTQSQRSPYQDGGTYINSKLEPRDIFMQVTISASTEQELFKLRQNIQKIFNPKLGEGILIYETPNGNKMLYCSVDSMPIFSNLTNKTIICQIDLLANDPFWYELNSDSNLIINEFDISMQNIEVNNKGTVYTPLEIEVSGEINGLTITNETTDEALYIIKPLSADEKLIINTKFGELSVKLIESDGNEKNALSYLSLHSDFIQLDDGINIFTHEKATEEEIATIKIKYSNRYIGL